MEISDYLFSLACYIMNENVDETVRLDERETKKLSLSFEIVLTNIET